MDPHLDVVVIVVILKVGGGGIDNNERDVASGFNLSLKVLRQTRDPEYARNEIHWHRIHLESHVLAKGYPAHPDIVRVFAGQVEDPPLLDASGAYRAGHSSGGCD